MYACRHILFPVDFSERCEAAAPHVAGMARRLGAGVTLMHVVQPIPHALRYRGGGDDSGLDPAVELSNWMKHCHRRLDAYTPGLWRGLRLFRAVEQGEAGEAIARHAASKQVDLIMMPTHGRGGFRRFLFGSVTTKVMHDAPCPVWTDAHSEGPIPDRPDTCGQILCALDLEPGSLAILHWASEFAAACHAQMRLVHAIPQAEHLTGQPDAEFTAFLRGVARDKLAKLQVEAGVNHEAIVSGGGVASSVAGMARECGADLIVAGRGPSQDGGRRLGRQINAILLAAPCSLISL